MANHKLSINRPVGLVDADLLCKGTRHPNLVLLKLAGYFRDHNIPYDLIVGSEINLDQYQRIYLSRVFVFTTLPKFIEEYIKNHPRTWKRKIQMGGTGFYALEEDKTKFSKLRMDDMNRLSCDPYLVGFSMAHQMPDYNLYNNFIDDEVQKMVESDCKKHLQKIGMEPTEEELKKFDLKHRKKYKDYLYYSIGFLTRGCFRKCPFCVNKLENRIYKYSELSWFLDNERDDKGKLKRPYIYLWDDNFLAAPPYVWRSLLRELMETGRPFQFRQGLDERMIADSPYGEEIAETLSKCKYHGDYIFAFDNWEDRPKIEKALKIWKRYNRKETKFYLFCGYKLTSGNDEYLYHDIKILFDRIHLLMQYGCFGYVMRHADYENHNLSSLYVQIARWCNQPQFYRHMSFWEYCYRNQSFWEQNTMHLDVPNQIPYEEFERRYRNGYYEQPGMRLCKTMQTFMDFMDRFPEHQDEILIMSGYKLTNLTNPALWEND